MFWLADSAGFYEITQSMILLLMLSVSFQNFKIVIMNGKILTC